MVAPDPNPFEDIANDEIVAYFDDAEEYRPESYAEDALAPADVPDNALLGFDIDRDVPKPICGRHDYYFTLVDDCKAGEEQFRPNISLIANDVKDLVISTGRDISRLACADVKGEKVIPDTIARDLFALILMPGRTFNAPTRAEDDATLALIRAFALKGATDIPRIANADGAIQTAGEFEVWLDEQGWKATKTELGATDRILDALNLERQTDVVAYARHGEIEGAPTPAATDYKYIVDRLFCPGDIMLLAAPAGNGKSQLINQLGQALIRGRRWLGYQTEKTGVTYFDLENPPDYIKDMRYYQYSLAHYDDDARDCYLISREFANPEKSPAAAKKKVSDSPYTIDDLITAMAEDCKYLVSLGCINPVIVIDNFRALAMKVAAEDGHDLDENKNLDVGKVFEKLDCLRFGIHGFRAGIIVLHHFKKAGDNYSGAAAFESYPAVTLTLDPIRIDAYEEEKDLMYGLSQDEIKCMALDAIAHDRSIDAVYGSSEWKRGSEWPDNFHGRDPIKFAARLGIAEEDVPSYVDVKRIRRVKTRRGAKFDNLDVFMCMYSTPDNDERGVRFYADYNGYLSHFPTDHEEMDKTASGNRRLKSKKAAVLNHVTSAEWRLGDTLVNAIAEYLDADGRVSVSVVAERFGINENAVVKCVRDSSIFSLRTGKQENRIIVPAKTAKKAR